MRMSRSIHRIPVVLAAALGAIVIATSTPAIAASRPLHLFARDSGRTIAIPVGQEFYVTLPVRRPDINSWYVQRNFGGFLTLVSGPIEGKRVRNGPGSATSQTFCFRLDAPGIAHLVLDQDYKFLIGGRPVEPFVLEVVDP
jgi:hypothetical protein